ncbi:hypothetical protein C2845_PM01G16530 [Panicum miliaceum]|uniref:Uncharacterized protein n=1 Tax=Panicum miliaceum TaxID=4540 RepID=A0A3L6THW0_PANMI|nr:hypothetical protein C2845_PM01G16530 [Panicum miliaceum]
MRSSPAEGWAKTGQMAPPLAQSSPPGNEEQGRKGRREFFFWNGQGRREYERRERFNNK